MGLQFFIVVFILAIVTFFIVPEMLKSHRGALCDMRYERLDSFRGDWDNVDSFVVDLDKYEQECAEFALDTKKLRDKLI